MATDDMDRIHAEMGRMKNDAHSAGDTSGFNVAAVIPMRPAAPGGAGTRSPSQDPYVPNPPLAPGQVPFGRRG